MRISTSQIYDAGSLNIQRNQAALFKLQNQLSTGRRVLTPEDDPVAAAQALLVTQAKEMNTQQTTNQGTAKSQLGIVDSQLSSLVDLIQNVRERVIQAGNGSLSNADRQSIATELESRFSELIGIANAQNGSGDYLFSGYQGATKPFAIDASQSAVAYYGDDGERLLQVSSSRTMPVNVAGSDVFMDVKQGNGTFVVKTGNKVDATGVPVIDPVTLKPVINQGSATADSGSVRDLQKWQQAVNALGGSSAKIEVRFSVDVTTGATTYALFNGSGVSAPALGISGDYVSGQAIPLTSTTPPAAQFVVQGAPKDGDTFQVAPSTNQSLFKTMQSLIGILKTPIGTSTFTNSEYSNALGQQLVNLDRALDNVSTVQSSVGTRMGELESLADAARDLNLQYQTTHLEAAQKSFAQISGLSLFNYL